GHRQEEGIDYEEVFAPVGKIEVIRLFLAYAYFMGFMVYQMDVKSAFLYGTIEYEVYVTQPPGFKDPANPDKVYKVVKALYVLHQAPRAWYETLANYLLGNGFKRGKIDQTLFIKKQKGDILLVQVYADDIIFGSTNKKMCTRFEKLMKDKFQMSSIGELNFFLGLQVHQKEDGIFISQDKYVDEILKKFNYIDVKSTSTLVDLEKPLVKDGDANDVDVHLYRSMIRSSIYLTTSRPDIMFACKKQTMVATSTTEAEYVTAASCCGQVPWIQNQLLDYGYNFMNTMIHMDNNNLLTKGFDARRLVIRLSIRSLVTEWKGMPLLLLAKKQSRKVVTTIRPNPWQHLMDQVLRELVQEVVLVIAAELLTIVRHHLVLPVQVNAAEGDFINTSIQEIIDFLNANQIHYALTVNPTIYKSCIEQFWETTKAKTINGERQLQALVDKKKVIITETSIRSDLHLEDAGGTDCLPTATIYEELVRMRYEKPSQRLTFYKAFFSPQWKFLIHTITQCLSAKTTAWNEFSSTMASAIICLATNQKFNFSKYIFDAMVKHLEGGVKFLMYPRFVQVFINQQLGDMSHHKKIYVTPSHTKKIFANMKREGKDFSGRVTPLFATMMVQANQEEGVDSGIPTDSQQTPITTQPSSSRPQKKQSRRKQRKETEVPQDETHHDDSVPIPSNDPLLSGEDRMQLTELMILCTNLQKQVLDLEKAKDAQAKEIAGLKKRVQKLERKKKSRTTGLKRLRKVGESRRVESSEDKDSLGAQEDASKQGRSFEDIDKDAEVSLVDETQGRSDDAEMFDTDDLHGDEVIVDMAVGEKQEQSAKVDEREVSTGVEDSVAPTIPVTTAAITTAATTTTTTRPKARGAVVQEPNEFRTTTSSPQASQPSKTKDKGKAIMIELERLARKKEEKANIALIESWENTQAMMKADKLLAERLQTREQDELTDEEKAKLFMEFMEKRRKHFAALRTQKKRKRPSTKTQKRNQMSIYLKHMVGYKYNQLKGRSYDEIQKLFDKEMKRVNSFVAMNSKAQEISGKKDESSSKKTEIAQDSSAKRVGDKLESDNSKKQKTDEHEKLKYIMKLS
ncbi:putative ribonuclease H-like domain-containing protein, partial [Tanacetum coccineum]